MPSVPAASSSTMPAAGAVATAGSVLAAVAAAAPVPAGGVNEMSIALCLLVPTAATVGSEVYHFSPKSKPGFNDRNEVPSADDIIHGPGSGLGSLSSDQLRNSGFWRLD